MNYWSYVGIPFAVSKEQAFNLVCKVFELTPIQLRSRSRLRHIIEAKAECYKRGEKYNKKKFNEMKERCTYSNVKPELRTKVYNINYNEEDIELLKRQVNKCRNYIETLKNKINYAE